MRGDDQVFVLLCRPWQLPNMARTFQIFDNGSSIASIKNGQTIALPLALGEHEIVAKIDWCRSKPITLRLHPDSEASIRVRCSIPWWAMLIPYLIFVYILIPGWYLEVELV